MAFLAVTVVQQSCGCLYVLAGCADGRAGSRIAVNGVYLGELGVLTLDRGDRGSGNELYAGINLLHRREPRADSSRTWGISGGASAGGDVAGLRLFINHEPVVVEKPFLIPLVHLGEEFLAARLDQAVLHDAVLDIEIIVAVEAALENTVGVVRAHTERDLYIQFIFECCQDRIPFVDGFRNLQTELIQPVLANYEALRS